MIAVLLLAGSVALAQSQAEKKQQVLDKIDSLIAEGDFDTAKRMIDHFLDKNPGDKELAAKLEKWRIARGDVGPILAEEGLATPEKRKRLRELCWKITGASMQGNPEEWEALLDTGEPKRAAALLSAARKKGKSSQELFVAHLLIAELERAKALPRPTEEQVRSALAGPDGKEKIDALGEVERRKLKAFRTAANKLFKGGADLETRYAAAAALLALGDAKPRKSLLNSLKSEKPVEAVLAMEVLARHPGKGKRPLQALYATIEADEAILRVKGTLLSVAIRGIGDRKEDGALAFLTKKLTKSETAVDAARALGVLGDPAATAALLAFLKAPPKDPNDTAGSGLGFLGGAGGGMKAAAAAEELRPRLVGALAILSVTAPKK